ncbi:uncharacterized protein LOC131163767 [Malania oleifera]|uniref:uncharacterized protein LOC131163767 n=1 Tax=Malania oleifera TaxID=397392 RepID=UPI0025AE29CC|nr:uncharacterized protein LOC131163767 [Malania oleifera]
MGKESERRRMETKKMIAVVMVMVCLVSSHQLGIVEAGPEDCYDACSTGCVQPDTRLMQRCDIKCQIKCSADSQDKKIID